MFQSIFNWLWSSARGKPGDGNLEALKVAVRQGKRYKATITLSSFEQLVATNDAIKAKLTEVGFKDVQVKGNGAKRSVEGLWGKADTSAELDPHLSNVVEIVSAAPAPASVSAAAVAPAPAPAAASVTAAMPGGGGATRYEATLQATQQATVASPAAPTRGVGQSSAPGPAPAPAPAATSVTPTMVASSDGGGHYEAVVIDGQLVAADFLLFASQTVTPKQIRDAKAKYPRVMVGFDAGAIPKIGEIYEPSFKVARDLGAELQIYVEGPGGPTGTTGEAKDETMRVEAAARHIGINTSMAGWRKKLWNTGGWKTFTFEQLELYRKQGFNAAEIDNLEHVLPTPEARVAFYKEYAQRRGTDTLPQLVMKNVDVEEMESVVAAVEKKELPRAMFSEFHIFECGKSERWRPVDAISKRIAIRTVPSRNTYRYNAEGEFRIPDKELRAAYGLDMPSPSPSPAPPSGDTPVA